MISEDVVILTKAEFSNRILASFQSGVERGTFDMLKFKTALKEIYRITRIQNSSMAHEVNSIVKGVLGE